MANFIEKLTFVVDSGMDLELHMAAGYWLSAYKILQMFGFLFLHTPCVQLAFINNHRI